MGGGRGGALTERSVLQRGQVLLIESQSLMHFTWKSCLHFRSFTSQSAVKTIAQIEHYSSSPLSLLGLCFFSGISFIWLRDSPFVSLVV